MSWYEELSPYLEREGSAFLPDLLDEGGLAVAHIIQVSSDSIVHVQQVVCVSLSVLQHLIRQRSTDTRHALVLPQWPLHQTNMGLEFTLSYITRLDQWGMISICAECITGSSSLPAGSVYQSSHCSRLSGDGRGSFGRGLGSVQPDGCRTCWPHKDLSLFVATRCLSQPRETPAGAKHDACNKQHEPQKSSNGIHSTFNMHYIKKIWMTINLQLDIPVRWELV